MNILAIGDVVGSVGCKFLRKHLPSLKKIKQIDMVIANGENSADGNGITPTSAQHLFDSGVDIITAGNHTFRRKECYDYFDECETLIRPANFPKGAPGRGCCVYDMGRYQVGVINVMGVVYMEPMDCPFETVDKLLPDMPKTVRWMLPAGVYLLVMYLSGMWDLYPLTKDGIYLALCIGSMES